MPLDPADIPAKFENHELRISALEKGMSGNRQLVMWIIALAVQTGILYAALRH